MKRGWRLGTAVACLLLCGIVVSFAQDADSRAWDDALRLFDQGNAAYEEARFRDAINLYEQSLAIIRELDEHYAEGVVLNNLGNCHFWLSDYTQAIDCFEQALAICVALGDRAGVASCLGNLGNCYFRLTDYTRAIDCFEHGLAIFIALGDRAGEGRGLSGLGTCYAFLSDYSRAIDYHERSLAIWRAIGNRVGEAYELGNLGFSYKSLSDYTQAIDCFEQALAICVALGDRVGEANGLGSLGNCHYDLSDYTRAIDYYEEALSIERALGDRAGEASSLGNIGNCYYSLFDYDRAIDYFEQALAIFVAIGNRAGEANSLGNLGNCWSRLSDYSRAIGCLERALAIFIDVGDRYGEAKGLGNLGVCYSRLFDYARAIGYYEQALDLATELGAVDVARWVHRDSGRTYRAMGEWERATEHYEAAIAIAESIRGNVDEEALRRSYLEGVRTTYEEYLSLLLELGRKSETFLVAERLRARTFLDGLYQAGLSPEALSMSEAGVRSSGDETLPVLDAALLEHAVDDGRESLLANEAVLEYMVTDNGVYLWVVTSAGISDPIFIQYPRQDLIADVRALREMIEATEPDSIMIQSKQMALYRTLVQPGLALLGDAVDTLVFIPSGPLWYVPFSALGTPYLVERYTIAYLPSLASLTSLAGDEEQAVGRGVIALANPTLSPEQLEELGMTGTKYQYDELEKAALGFANCYIGQENTVYTEADAEEPRAYELEGAFDVAIYACHGLFSPNFPLESKLLLAPGGSTTSEDDVRNPEDGNYSAKEVLLTDHRGVELVVLAACETLLPSFRNLQDTLGTLSGTDPREVKLTREQLEQLVVGDEVVGLARAFLSSGAQSVLGTLWQANPKAVTALLVSMCKHYRAGLTWAQALCAAQRELIPVYANIWSWAPYQLIGRWR